MSVFLRREQECSMPGCGRPARIGVLCAPCWYAATPARRAVELGWEDARAEQVRADALARREACELRALFEAPAYGEVA